MVRKGKRSPGVACMTNYFSPDGAARAAAAAAGNVLCQGCQ